MVFDPAIVHSSREEFLKWYDDLTQWGEGHSYCDPVVTTTKLKDWYGKMIEDFPAMNGPDATQDPNCDHPSQTDYCISKSAIYAGFRWSLADVALTKVFETAKICGVCFYDVGDENSGIWIPDVNEGYKVVFEVN